jgi:thiol-disulfide isomerase/thioredoxin
MIAKARMRSQRHQKIAHQRTNQALLLGAVAFISLGVLLLALTRPRVEEGFAPDFSARTLGGGQVSLSDYKGQVVMLNFWATWCPPCRAEMPHMQEAYERYSAQGFSVLAINNAEAEANVAAFAEQYGLDFPVVLDGGTLQRMFRISGYPTSIFLRRDGSIYATHNGGLSAAQLESYIQQGLQQQ